MIGMVTNEGRDRGHQKTKGTIVDGRQNRHVIRIHNAVRKTDGLPLGDESSGTRRHLFKPQSIFFGTSAIAYVNSEISQLLNFPAHGSNRNVRNDQNAYDFVPDALTSRRFLRLSR